MDFQIIGYVISASPGLASLYLYWKKLKKEEPKVDFKVVEGCFKIEKKDKGKDDLILTMKILFENRGNASGSITDLVVFIRYSEEAVKMYPFVLGMINSELVVSERPTDYLDVFPIEIGPYGSKLIELKLIFENIYPDFLDRCYMPLNLKNPKKWEWSDLPVLFKMVANTTVGNIKKDVCLFREDLPESKKVRGTLDVLEHSKIIQEFTPKIEF
ncbi:MAG: hypothetical protein H0Z28_03410 [Archaeoglobus sp.]|nr:hypothetical protein [Archaeoglobus sp.]